MMITTSNINVFDIFKNEYSTKTIKKRKNNDYL